MHISQRAKEISGSLTVQIDTLAKKLKEEGKSIVGFGAGEPDFDTPAHIVDAARQAMQEGHTRYTAVGGILKLRQAICDELARKGLAYTPEQIIVSNGAKHALHNVMCAVLEPGDEVIIPRPYWVSYPEQVVMAGARPVYVQAEAQNDFNATAEAIEAAITDKTRMLILNSPGNPCGNIYSEQELRAIADVAIKHDLTVLSDEIYDKLVYDGKTAPSIAALGEEIKQRTVVINGVSKTYAMTGWRIGYAACAHELATAITRWQSHTTSSPNSIAQLASLAALKGEQKAVGEMRQAFQDRRDYMVQRINSMPLVSCRKPSGAFYVMMDIAKTFGASCHGKVIADSIGLAEQLLNYGGVAVVPGIGFGAEGYARLSYATSREEIELGMDRLETFLSELELKE